MKIFDFGVKTIIFCVFITLSCESKKSMDSLLNQNTNTINNDYSTKNSPNNTYTLYYKISEKENSPVKWISYYVIKNSDKKTVKKEEGIAAEKIYWKNDNTIAIIPYQDIIQASSLEDDIKSNEIMIKLE